MCVCVCITFLHFEFSVWVHLVLCNSHEKHKREMKHNSIDVTEVPAHLLPRH